MRKTSSEDKNEYTGTELERRLKKTFMRTSSFIIGFFLSGTSVFGENIPFSLSLCTALGGMEAFWAFVGGTMGIVLFLAGTGRIRALCCAVGLGAVKLACAKLNTGTDEKKLMSFAAAFLSLISGTAVMAATGVSVDAVLITVWDSLLLGLAVPAFAGTVSCLKRGAGAYFPDSGLLAAVTAAAGIILCCASSWDIAGFYPGRAAATLIIMASAYLGGVTGGAAAGICAGLAVTAAGAGGSSVLLLYWPTAGLVCGFLSGHKRAMLSVGSLVTVCVFALADSSANGVFAAAEAATAACLFLCIPEKPLQKLKIRFVAPEIDRVNNVGNDIAERLRRTARAVESMSGCVKTVSEGLEEICRREDGAEEEAVRGAVCSGCLFCGDPLCPENGDIAFALKRFRREGSFLRESFREKFRLECPYSSAMVSAVGEEVRNSAATAVRDAHAQRGRELACKMFSAVSGLLGELSAGLTENERNMAESENLVRRTLEEMGAAVFGVRCTEPVQGALTLEIELALPLPKKLDEKKITEAASAALAVEFLPPETEESGDRLLVKLERAALFRLNLGFAGEAALPDDLCGDYYETFSDGAMAYIIISDGMGTGGRAAVDAAMTANLFSKLIKAGLTAETALALTNAAMNVRSADESSATLDVAAVNLFTGETAFMKAGAAQTVFTRGGAVKILETESVPLGILSDVTFKTKSQRLEGGDIILMMSDGIGGEDAHWVGELLRRIEAEPDAEEVAGAVLSAAKKRAGERRDDMTVVSAVLEVV